MYFHDHARSCKFGGSGFRVEGLGLRVLHVHSVEARWKRVPLEKRQLMWSSRHYTMRFRV